MPRRGRVRGLVLLAIAFTVLWLLVLHLAAELLPLSGTPWVTNLRAALINLISLVVPLLIITRLRWWARSALIARRPDGSWLLLLPLLAVSLGYAYGGLTGSVGVLASSAVLYLALGANEEVMFRGLVQAFSVRSRYASAASSSE